MGRIAEALKKAQRERDETLRLGLGKDGGGGTDTLTPDGSEADAGPARSRPRSPHPRRMTPDAQGLPIGMATPAWTARRTAPIAPMPHWDVDSSVVAVHDRSSTITEQYRAIRTWLLSHATVGENHCVAITSSVSREGKTVTSANLAVTLAEVRHLNVLVVDADLRRGSLGKLFKVTDKPGLADVLAGQAQLSDAIRQTPIPNLSFLPASECGGLNPTELFNSKAAGLVFDEIRERYHFVVVDTPPVQSFSDVGVIGALCSGIIMVVRMHKTTSGVVRQSVQWLQANSLNVLGCVAAANSQKPAQLVYQYDGAE